MNKITRYQNIAHYFYKKDFVFIAKIICHLMRFFYSCEIAYQAEIAPDVTFAHNGLGVVIGHNAVIGHRTHILHNVTIGGRGEHKSPDGRTNPIIGNNVLIGAGACVLGPIVINDNVKIGANAVVISDIQENNIAIGIPAKILK